MAFDSISIGRNIKHYRNEKGISQKWLGSSRRSYISSFLCSVIVRPSLSISCSCVRPGV